MIGMGGDNHRRAGRLRCLGMVSCLALGGAMLGAASPTLASPAATVTPPSSPSTAAGTSRATAAALAARPLPALVRTGPGVRQMVTVTSRGWNTTRATLRTWQRPRGGPWQQVRGPIRARIGFGGWVRGQARRQGTGTSPAGKYRLPRAFGSLADPGGAMPYRRFDRNDFWPYEPRDPATYNVYQLHKAATTHWRRGFRERLWDFRGQYRYAVVVGFNLPSEVHFSQARRQWVARDRADTSRGGGIFLHVTDGGPTAGCVSMRIRAMRRLVRWLDPARAPLVAMGPRRYVRRL
jgi:L,D-peptidoglycan transpeptidase YkuD (ErfK/YbiS/YcfS/YnhG family)